MRARAGSNISDTAFASRLQREIEGEVYFDLFTRSYYATDASIYKIMPLGVAMPRTEADIAVIASLAAEAEIPIIARGGGTSTAGQTVGEGLVIDFSKYLHKLTFYDLRSMTCAVQPGMTLNALNADLVPHGVWFPVDIWSGSQATIGGMCGNNAVGLRSLRYGAMRDNVTAIDAILPDGSEYCFGEIKDDSFAETALASGHDLAFNLLQTGERYETLIRSALKNMPKQAGGYNLAALLPKEGGTHNLAPLLIGSEGTLALSKRIELKLQPLPRNWALGICQFPSLRKALSTLAEMTQLQPSAIDLIEASLLAPLAARETHEKIVERCLRGAPATLLIVEFAEDNQVENMRRLKALHDIVSARGQNCRVIEAVGTELQRATWDARDAALEALFTATDGQGLPFLEDCAVPFSELISFTDRIGELLSRSGLNFAWHGFAIEGALVMRPLYQAAHRLDRIKIRALAEAVAAEIRALKGAQSAGQGSGLARSEFNEAIYGRSTVGIFEEIKALFDPQMRFNPGKIVFAPRADDAMLQRRRLNGHAGEQSLALNWPLTSRNGTKNAALVMAESCNGVGVCRKLEGGEMCPAFRVTRDERLSPRGMANAFRMALTGEEGTSGLASPELMTSLKHCVSCKACRTECPMSVDIAKLKIEAMHALVKQNGLSLGDKMFAYLPRYAAQARRWRWGLYLRDAIPALARATEALTGFSADRSLPRWEGRRFRPRGSEGPETGRPVVLFADTFNQHFEPDNLRAAAEVLVAAGYRVHYLTPPKGERPYCCGRTFLSAGLVEEARSEAERLSAALAPFIEAGTPVIGLEPACLLTMRDEFSSLLQAERAEEVAAHAYLFEEFVARERKAQRFQISLRPIEADALLHGHCHQKAFGCMEAVKAALSLIPALSFQETGNGCCGMAGSFGYRAETIELSLAMGEQSLFPAIRKADRDTLIIADGFSCRQQIRDATGRTSRHTAVLFRLALNEKYNKQN